MRHYASVGKRRQNKVIHHIKIFKNYATEPYVGNKNLVGSY